MTNEGTDGELLGEQMRRRIPKNVLRSTSHSTALDERKNYDDRSAFIARTLYRSDRNSLSSSARPTVSSVEYLLRVERESKLPQEVLEHLNTKIVGS